MTNEEAISEIKAILEEATETEDAVCYVTSVDAESLNLAIEALSRSEFPNSSDMISRQAAIDALDKRFDDIPMEQTQEILLLRRDLRTLPSAQPETAKRIAGKSRDGMTMWYQCDMCNEPVDEKDTFCRGCGRRFVNG